MAREHAPIQIGLPAESAWDMPEPAPVSYLSFVVGEDQPDPGDAFIAIGESFGVAPQDIEPVPLEDEAVAWAFSCSVPGRPARLMVWCERAIEGASPDGKASDARWVVFVETILDSRRPVEDAVALAASVARAGGVRTRLVFDPGLGVAWGTDETEALFLAKDGPVDERHLYRVELVARDRANGPFWVATVGLARIGRPEIEMLEVPGGRLRAALELIDAVAARLVEEELPAAGSPFEAGPGVKVAFVPVHEVIETIAPDAPGGARDRGRLPAGPRAAICAAGKRGAFRQVWVAPLEELDRISANQAGLFIAPRVGAVRARVARESFAAFRRAHGRRGDGEAVFLAKVAVPAPDGGREHAWITIESLRTDGGSGLLARDGRGPERIEFALADLGDWRIVGASADAPEVGPESAALLA